MRHSYMAKAHSLQRSDIIIWIIMVVLLIALGAKIASLHENLTCSSQMQSTVLITELMPSNIGTITNEDGQYCDWIELHNPTDHPIDLKGYSLTDDAKMPDKCVLPHRVLEPGEHAIVYADDQSSTITELHAAFKLTEAGEILIMIAPGGMEIQRIAYPPMESNQSYAMLIDTLDWTVTDRCTPGLPNTDSGYAAYLEGRRADSPVMINEVMAGNTITLRDEDGDYPDWAELYNTSEETIDLTGWGLSDTEDNPKRWIFPPAEIGPGDHMIVFLSGKNRAVKGGEPHTNFKLNGHQDTLLLTNFSGQIISEVEISGLESDHAYGLIPGTETWQATTKPTPGNPNDEEGWIAFQPTLYTGMDTPVIINEIMSNNPEPLPDLPNVYPDWIELYNRSDETVNLAGWGLSDDTDTPGRWRFPAYVLDPGEFVTVYTSGQTLPDGYIKGIHADFSIGSEGDIVVLTDPAGQIADCCFVPPLRIGLTYQREQNASFFTYCHHATPNAANSEGFQRITTEPTFSLTAGMYDDAQMVALSDDSGARVYYTLDGTTPDENSTPYTEPIRVETTTAVLAVAYRDGYLPSATVCATYLIGENIDLPVVSIVTDPANLFDEETGIYVNGPGWTPKYPHLGANFWQDWERPAHMELFEPNGTVGISQDIGIKIFGGCTREKDKKSFALMCRQKYGISTFSYEVFPELPYTDYKSLIVRSAQDGNMTHIRDKLLVDLALENSNMDGQAHRQSILFVNGEFWGIYDLMEKINEHFLALHHEINPDMIDLLVDNGEVVIGSNEEYMALIEYVKTHDLFIQENYNHVTSKIDIDNFIDWYIIEMCIANEDLTMNVKYWKPRSQEGKWRWILYDLDFGFYNLYQPYFEERLDIFSMFFHPEGTGNEHHTDNTLIRGLLQNEVFKQKFIKRFVYHCTVTFAPEKVLRRIDELAANIEPYVQRDKDRWPGGTGGTVESWRQMDIQLLKDFAIDRPAINLHYMQQYFGLTDAEMDNLIQEAGGNE